MPTYHLPTYNSDQQVDIGRPGEKEKVTENFVAEHDRADHVRLFGVQISVHLVRWREEAPRLPVVCPEPVS